MNSGAVVYWPKAIVQALSDALELPRLAVLILRWERTASGARRPTAFVCVLDTRSI